MKAVVAAFNQEKALVGAFSVITNLRMQFGCNFLKHYYQARDVETGTLMAAKQISFCRNSEEEQERVETLIREEVLLISGKGANEVS